MLQVIRVTALLCFFSFAGGVLRAHATLPEHLANPRKCRLLLEKLALHEKGRSQTLSASDWDRLDEIARWEQTEREILYDEAFNSHLVPGVGNFKAFKKSLEELSEATAQKRSVGVIYLDLDGLKAMNGFASHESADRVLKVILETVHRQLRTTDLAHVFAEKELDGLAFHLHGDEMVVTLSDATHIDIVAKRIHDSISELTFDELKWASEKARVATEKQRVKEFRADKKSKDRAHILSQWENGHPSVTMTYGRSKEGVFMSPKELELFLESIDSRLSILKNADGNRGRLHPAPTQ